MNVVSCSARDHRRIPILIPLDATTVRLDGNDFGRAVIDTQSFLGRDNVRELYLNDSGIVALGNATFSGLGSLQKHPIRVTIRFTKSRKYSIKSFWLQSQHSFCPQLRTCLHNLNCLVRQLGSVLHWMTFQIRIYQ